MLCPADALNYNEIYRQKSLISAFKQAGFHTSFLSNQLRNGSFTEFFADEADCTIYFAAPKNKPHLHDDVLLSAVDSLLNIGKTKQLIILHTYGSHFNYCERYDTDCRIFTPDHIKEIDHKNKQAMINAYDNSIVATDKFLAQVIDKLDRTGKTSAMLYLSDHGEDLLDDERNRFLHASPFPPITSCTYPLSFGSRIITLLFSPMTYDKPGIGIPPHSTRESYSTPYWVSEASKPNIAMTDSPS